MNPTAPTVALAEVGFRQRGLKLKLLLRPSHFGSALCDGPLSLAFTKSPRLQVSSSPSLLVSKSILNSENFYPPKQFREGG